MAREIAMLTGEDSPPREIYRSRILALSAVVFIETLLLILLFQNRAKRRRAEEALGRRETELFEAQRLARLGSWQWDPASDAITWSEALYNLTGFDSLKPLPAFHELARFFDPESWKHLTQSMEEALGTGQAFELVVKFLPAEGAGLWLAVRGEAVRDAQGAVLQLRGTMQDITERKQAEEVRLKHAAIVESSDDAIVSKNLDGIITSWNAGAQRIFGFSEAEAVGRSISLIIPPELHDEESTILKKIRSGERIEHYETTRINKQGERVFVSLTISPVKDLTGRIVGASKIARDITERKRAAEQLKKSEEMFAKAFRRGPMAIALTNAKSHRYIDVNETFEHMTGFSREEVIGHGALERGIWVDPLERVRLSNKLVADGSIRDAAIQFLTKDGRPRVAQASGELIDLEGELCIMLVMIDITERKQAEQKLQESERRFRLMADSAPVLMWISGPDKLCTDFNQEWLAFTGRPIERELGEGWTENVYPDDFESCLLTYQRAFDARQAFTMEYRLRRHDGRYRWLLDRGAPRFLESGEFAGYIGCCTDITDQKEVKAAQAELSGRLIEAQEAERARIARDLHDDINQRLALLANGLQELQQRDTERDESEDQRQLHELWNLTNEIALDIQQLSHRLHPSKLHYLGLPAAVRELCKEFSKAHKIEVECVAQDVPRDLKESAALSLFRTVQESLHNVAKHSSARHVKVDLSGRSTGIHLRVADDGVGFDVSQKHGRGLGLVSIEQRLRSIGGRLTVWSQPSAGTLVEATVPVGALHVRRA
jgi:PAS domain S-box-containing protein